MLPLLWEIELDLPSTRLQGGYLVSAVDEVLVEKLFADPPHALHEGRVQRLVVVLMYCFQLVERQVPPNLPISVKGAG